MIKPYTSQQPVDDFGLLFADLKYVAVLAASVDTVLTIPGNAPRYKAVIKVTSPAFVALNAVASVPGSSSFVSSAEELILDEEHLCREVRSGDVLHFISSTNGTIVSVVLYSMFTNN